MSSTRGSAVTPLTVTFRYVAFSLVAHSADKSPGTLTYGVSMVGGGVVHGRGGALPTIKLPVVERYECSTPLPPPSAAGFVHAATISGSATLPNNVLAGGGTVDRNDAYTIRQPVWVAA